MFTPNLSSPGSWTSSLQNCYTVTPAFLCFLSRSVLDKNEIQPIHPKGNQSWIFNERTDAEAETPILWPPDAKSWLTGKDPDAGKDWRQEEKGTTEDEIVGWHHRLSAHGFGWTLGLGDGQGGLACCGPWGRKESDTTERLNWTVWVAQSCPDSLWPSGRYPRWFHLKLHSHRPEY